LDGLPAKYYENWQQGILITTTEDVQAHHELIQITDGVAWFRGKKFTG
jgi:hypothetical protein